MTEETVQTNDTAQEEVIVDAPAQDAAVQQRGDSGRAPRPARGRAPRGGDRGPRGGNRGGGERRSEFSQKMIGIRRVARVMAGGRRFNFSVAMVLGDKKGRVGVGLGKAADTALAIDKASRDAKRNMIQVNLTKNRSIRHDTQAKYCASVVGLRPSAGRGLVAGSSVRIVLELAGITDVTAKLLSRSKNPINNARAAIEALRPLSLKK